MLFTRTYVYKSTASVHDIKNRLLGDPIKVHTLDFEVSEKGQVLSIFPLAEEITEIRILPVTHIKLHDKGSKTQIIIKSEMHRPDAGGPMLVVGFCVSLFIVAIMFFIFGKEDYAFFTYVLSSIGLLIFIGFWIRLETGYFDYMRKVRDFVKHAGR